MSGSSLGPVRLGGARPFEGEGTPGLGRRRAFDERAPPGVGRPIGRGGGSCGSCGCEGCQDASHGSSARRSTARASALARYDDPAPDPGEVPEPPGRRGPAVSSSADEEGSDKPIETQFDLLCPPAEQEWGSACPGGSEVTCGCVPLLRRDGLAIPYENVFEGSSNIEVDGGDGTDEQMVRTAWTVLAQNLDLVDWALCYATGSPNSGACVRRSIEWVPMTIAFDVRVGDSCFWGGSNVAIVPPRYKTIQVCHGPGTPWSLRRETWTFGQDAAKACVAIYLAASFFHELMHTCLRNTRPAGDRAYDCAETYLARSTLWWALTRRYGLEDHPCCTGRSDAFMSDGTPEMTDICARAEASSRYRP